MDSLLLILCTAAFLAFLIVSTRFIKRHADSETYFILSMVRLKRAIPVIKKFSFLGKFLSLVSIAGLVLGFGIPAVDFLFARKFRRAKRAALLSASFVLLYAFFSLLGIGTHIFGAGLSPLYPGAFALFGLMGFALINLADQGIHILLRAFQGQPSCPGVMPVIPGVQIPKVPIVIPLYVWAVFLIILTIHEGSHGIVALRHKIKPKSAGLLLLGLIPIGAFVEPDDAQFKKASERKQLSVYSAGPSANLFTFVLFFAVYLLVLNFYALPVINEINAFYETGIDHVEIASVQEEVEFCQEKEASPAFGVLREGMRVLEINGETVKSNVDVSNALLALSSASLQSGIPQNYTIKVETEAGEILEKELSLSERFGFAGFQVKNVKKPGFSPPPEYEQTVEFVRFVAGFLSWLFILSLILAIVNFLPLPLFDGGRIVPILLLPYFSSARHPPEKTKKVISVTLLFIVLALLLLNALPFFFL